MHLTSVNPATGKTLRRHRAHSPREIEARLARAHRATFAWRELPLTARARLLTALARTCRAQADSLAALVTAEMGKPLAEARAEAEKCAACLDFYAQHGPAFLRDESPPHAPARAVVACEPLGVILAIMPWNYPLWQVVRALAPALLSGNTVLLKHASNVSGCALALERLLPAAGLPAGLLQTLLTPATEASRLIADPRIRGLTFTGSTTAGRRVAALAGRALKPAVLELGGSDPYLILADADLDLAAEVCTSARLLNAGQSCVSAKRLIVVHSVLAAFEQKLLPLLARYPVGDPTLPSTRLGPLARPDLRTALHRQVTRSVRAGARLLLGGKIPPGPGSFYPVTCLSDVAPGMPAHDEELFGPVLSLIPVPDEAAALATANASPYGLGAAIFSRREKHASSLARKHLDAGMIAINAAVRSHPALPFGGTKASGHGRELAREGARAFINLKTLTFR